MALHPQRAGDRVERDRRDHDPHAGSRRCGSSTRRGRSPIPADRDHCIQYMVAVPLIFGRLTAADYEDDVAADPRIDALRAKMDVRRGHAVHPRTTSIPTSARSPTRSRSSSTTAASSRKSSSNIRSAIARRRTEGIPLLVEKFRTNLARRFPAKQQAAILAASLEADALEATPVNEYRRPVRHIGRLDAGPASAENGRPPFHAPGASDDPNLPPRIRRAYRDGVRRECRGDRLPDDEIGPVGAEALPRRRPAADASPRSASTLPCRRKCSTWAWER